MQKLFLKDVNILNGCVIRSHLKIRVIMKIMYLRFLNNPSLAMRKFCFHLVLLVSVICLGQKLRAQDNSQTVYLWPNGAPGFEDKRDEPEQAKDWWVRNIHNPSITVFLPPSNIATGAAVIIYPGGGHVNLVFNAEGRDAALYLNSIGVAAFVLKYRLFRGPDSKYTLENHVRQDAYRAMRLVRNRAAEWNIDTSRVGILGFSAGGEVASLIAYQSGMGNPIAPDPIDRLNGKPNFQMLVYPGPLGIPEHVSADAPPTFLVVANMDKCCSEPVIKLIQAYREAHLSVEAHIYAMGDHAFNMGYRSEYKSIKGWPQRMTEWLEDTNLLKKK